MNPGKTTDIESLETEIIIIGAGGGGLAAAVAAREKGADIILLEKRHIAGGNAAIAGGILAAGSRLQKLEKIDIRKDDLFKRAMAYAHWKVNPKIIRAFLDKSGDTIRWLEDNGVRFDKVPHFIPNEVPRLMHWPKGRGAGITRPLVKKCKEMGVRLLLKTAAKRILTDDNGNVSGVLAVTKEKELRIAARAIIIATGGYAGNKELLKKYYPHFTDDLISVGIPHMGDGILMATEIGAATEGLGVLHLRGPYYRGPKSIVTIAMEPNTIWVNRKGERFVDESICFNWPESANALNRQPEKISFSLFDESIKRGFVKDGLIKGYSRFPPTATMPDLEKKLKIEAEKGGIKIADSIEDIAEWIGADPSVLRATVDEYNRFSDQGCDEMFFKDQRYVQPMRRPPYYALKCYQGFLGTLGGIKINHHMEVLDQNEEPIRGLYAVGNDTGGWETDTYALVLPGSAYGFAVNSGRIAGENAAQLL